MKRERWLQVERIFNDALEREPHERASFLDQACGGDSWLRKKIEAMILSHEGAGSFLESPASAGDADRISIPGQFVGRRLGPYEVKMHLGSGGMGDVYRARDTKLKRDVAVKILPPEFGRDPDRVARFQREAVALAALNHPNIAAIYDLDEINGVRFLVLEFVEGETLAARLKRGPLSVDRAVEICRQVAEGLEAAHTKGIHHRDLKPANIQITPDHRVKLLDFGLAKMLAPEGESNDPSDPNITQWNTKPGVILGTATYLSPEQARGQKPDKRSDIWAFGCVLFEALTGRLAFPGDTVTDVLVAILKNEPEWRLLPEDLPSSVRSLLQRTLQKEPNQRLNDITDARIALQDARARGPLAAPQTTPAKRTSSWMTISVVAILAAGLAAAVTWNLRQSVPAKESPASFQSPDPTTRFSLALPQQQQLFRTLTPVIAISPDGANVVYVSDDRLYLRRISGEGAYPISGTDGALGPTFSPDGQWVAFWMRQDRTVKKIALGGGVPVTLSQAPFAPSNLSWDGDTIAYAAPDRGILAVSAAGSRPEVWVAAGPDEIVSSPQILDKGSAVLFSVTTSAGIDRWDKGDIAVLSRKTGERKILIHGGSDAHYIPTGHIVYVVGNTLFGVPFDPNRQQVTGGAVPILEGVLHTVEPVKASMKKSPDWGLRSNWPFGNAQFDFSANGTLIYVPVTPQTSGSSPPNREIRVVSKWFAELRRRVPGHV